MLTKISNFFRIFPYVPQNSCDTSHTWAAHIRRITARYDMMDPIGCLTRDPPAKSEYKEYVATKITAYYEQKLRSLAENNSCMEYLNVDLQGLRGKPHPALHNITTTDEVLKCRPHLKMLCGNLFTYEVKYNQSGIGSPHCRLCESPCESVSHIVATCSHLEDVRKRIFEEFQSVPSLSRNKLSFSNYLCDEKSTTQFILDPSSFNLKKRIHISDPILPQIFKISRDLGSALLKKRTHSLKLLQDKAKLLAEQ